MTQSPPKTRNAELTRAAILESARALFVELGYDGVGLREIAAGANVTAMMVRHYFGSKENLFVAVLEHVMAQPTVLTAEALSSSRLGALMATALVASSDSKKSPLDGNQMMMRSMSNKQIVQIGRAVMERDRHKGLAAALQGPLAEERAGVLLAIVGGFQQLRQIVEFTSLVNAKPEDLVKLLTAVFEVLIDPAVGTEPDGEP